MTLDALLDQLNGVRQRGSRWSALCPAHTDKSPSLSISEGDKGILIRCFTGCRLEEICHSLGIKPADLFFNALDSDPHKRRAAALRRDQQRQVRERKAEQQGLLVDAIRAADYHIRSRRNLDISGWNDQKLDDELNALADAYALIESEALHG